MKKNVIIIIFVTLLIASITLYNTFAINDNDGKSNDTEADYNLIYSIKENSDKEVSVLKKDVKLVDIVLTNTYESNIKYGVYYYMIEGDVNLIDVSLYENSESRVEDILKPNEAKKITIKILNNGESDVRLKLGALVGFEKGNIEELAKNGEILVK